MIWSIPLWAAALVLGGLAIWGFVYNYKKHMDSLDNGWPIVAMVPAIVLLITAVIYTICIGMSAANCERVGRNLGIETEYQVAGGCYVKYGDRLVPGSWMVPVIEGNRLRIEIENPQG